MKKAVAAIKKGVYRHYKNHLYRVIGEARHSETLEEMVVYEKLDDVNGEVISLWVRPKKMFLEWVMVDGKRVRRFAFVGQHLVLPKN